MDSHQHPGIFVAIPSYRDSGQCTRTLARVQHAPRTTSYHTIIPPAHHHTTPHTRKHTRTRSALTCHDMHAQVLSRTCTCTRVLLSHICEMPITIVRTQSWLSVGDFTSYVRLFGLPLFCSVLECQHTVSDLFAKATFPDRIFVGIFWQCDAEEDKHCFQVPYPRPEQGTSISLLSPSSFFSFPFLSSLFFFTFFLSFSSLFLFLSRIVVCSLSPLP